ncbi:hypothetical protein PMAYCL1PPCAC_08823, partial [Pristionchus mayeri]
VDEDHFIWLVDSLTERKWNFTSVDQALSVLCITDQFNMQHLHKHIIPYLKAAELGISSSDRIECLKRYIDISPRCRDNGELVNWIFERCESSAELIALAQSCGPTLAPHLPLFLRVLESAHANEKTKTEETMSKLLDENVSLIKKNEKLAEESNAKDFWYCEKEILALINMTLNDEVKKLEKQVTVLGTAIKYEPAIGTD